MTSRTNKALMSLEVVSQSEFPSNALPPSTTAIAGEEIFGAVLPDPTVDGIQKRSRWVPPQA